ncbi:MAG: selenide, water dikinase SelD, partial [Acidobacteriota bacterium]
KALGTGVLTTAAKRGMIEGAVLGDVVRQMAALNADAMEAGREAGVRACTDVTGFGLLGHLHELARASGVAARVEAARVPVLPLAREMIAAGAVPGGTHANAAFLAETVLWSEDVSPGDRTLLVDAQTSGGLLLAVEAGRAGELLEALGRRGVPGALIGELRSGTPGRIEVV